MMKWLLIGAVLLAGCTGGEEREYQLEEETEHWKIELSIEEGSAGGDAAEEVVVAATYLGEEHPAERVIITSLSSERNQVEMATSAFPSVESGETVEQVRSSGELNPAFLEAVSNDQAMPITVQWHHNGTLVSETAEFEVEENG
ncbi:hypothetical protein [Alkalicoccus urumqiensis]|uniref:Lipoprotein n=1 Tax=Alkalicoccus urumqiensis TaxID=1548213 RepID=A0A2P6MLK5_ALKUR|nr:hypothetical protein [Alkalicoccus urumqiensis]PRO67143.1 hypothetical protein C6I21_00835 [Alkalicoccus urumqiensis]